MKVYEVFENLKSAVANAEVLLRVNGVTYKLDTITQEGVIVLGVDDMATAGSSYRSGLTKKADVRVVFNHKAE